MHIDPLIFQGTMHPCDPDAGIHSWQGNGGPYHYESYLGEKR